MVENRVPAVRRVLGRAGQAGCAGVLFAVLAGGPALAQADPPPPVKYYIVPHADTPEDITLFKIAERALGDGRRFPEIFQLNQGRPRPDGTPFTDAAAIEPGQVLQLPEDAVQKPGVQFGPLPAPAPVAPAAPVAKPAPAEETSGLGVGLASAVSGTGGLLTGLLAGLWWRRRPQLLPPAPFEPPPREEEDFGTGSVSGTLPLPIVVPEPRPDVVLRPEPITAEHAIIVLDTAETQVIAAVRPGSRFHFRIGPQPDFADSATVLVVDGEGDRP
ncbi:LysM peptidoglycan-binding domain-containing protein [Amycolatopsis sp. NPDC058278]|uniref:LysM peptidoglycan-binding domain-containing protein n=1 Tax=Amycolatopsis sp. NPDC058278 TaxID=3346417 RepID=UPI0036D88558